MTASESLRQSSDLFFKLGLEFDAIFSRTLADQAERSGDALFANFAEQQAQRVIDKSTETGAGWNPASGVSTQGDAA